tara:strand:- start:288 stop:548 length:261 start_codon:yes stop_codon:yes gene_type:complete
MMQTEVSKPGDAFLIKFISADDDGHTLFTAALGWRAADEIQTKLAHLLLDHDIERGAYPIDDDPDSQRDDAKWAKWAKETPEGEPF